MDVIEQLPPQVTSQPVLPDNPPVQPADPPEQPANPPVRPGATGRARVARVLILVQLVLAVTSLVEASVVTAVGLGLPGPVLLTAVQIVLLALAAHGLGRGRRRRLAGGLQVASLVIAGVDLVIGAFVGVAPLLVPVIVRVLLPVAVLALLRRENRAVAR